jgi:hypothetical protein
MSRAKTQPTRSRGQRARKFDRRRAPNHFSQELLQLGEMTASLPEPVRRGVILWVRGMLALARLARREFGSLAARVLPPGRGSR